MTFGQIYSRPRRHGRDHRFEAASLGLVGIPAGLLTGLSCGRINGALIAGLKLPPFIMTLGTLTAVRGFARLLGNDQTIINSNLPFAFIGGGTLLGIPLPVLIAAAVVVASCFVLRRTVFGIHVYSVGGNAAGARLAGIRVWRVLLLAYSISGLCAGLGGVMSVGRLYAANGIQFGQSYELDAIAAVILGGTSFIWRHRIDLGHFGGRAHHRGDEQRAHPHRSA